ncbi:hypothetical protein [Streptomyces sp. NPDC007205]|uniref:hypothetical protein n=1 Tax=Streptomyces sp. NPDC007205 TaxID=3154316 RepID=UPI0033E6FCAD
MTAEETTETAGSTEGRSGDLRRDGDRIENWSMAWTLLALVMWGWFAYLLLADYGPENSASGETRSACRGPLLDPSSMNDVCGEDHLRQWPTLLGFLALALLPTVLAAATTVYAKVLSRLADQAKARS